MTTNRRVPHIIKPNKSGAGPGAWIVLDVATTPKKIGERKYRHVFKLASCAYWRPARNSKGELLERWTVRDSGSVIKDIVGRIGSKERIGVIAHNMDFQAQVLDIHCALRELGWRPTRIILDAGRWVQRWRQGISREQDKGRSSLWLDLKNFYPASLPQIRKWIGLPPIGVPNENATDEEWESWADANCETTLAALSLWMDFRSRFDLGYFAPTLASQSFNAYRHRFMSYPIYVHVHNDVLAIERESYFGGRVEIFWKGRAPKGSYSQVDVTSFYASVQLGQRFPTKQIGHAGRVSVVRLAELLGRFACIARVKIRTEDPRYPKRVESGVIYPIGDFETTLAGPELQTALDSGSIYQVEEVVTYEQAPIFDDYVKFFWELRRRGMQTSDRYVVELAKRFLTALYGKFGQRIWLSRLIAEGVDSADRIWKEYDWQDSQDYEYRIVGGRVERNEREMMGRDTLLAIPSYVTSYGRTRLWSLIEKVGLQHVFYVDTDSLIVPSARLKYIGDQFSRDTIGGLRITGVSGHLFIRAPKWYIFGDKTKRGGVQNNAVEVAWNRFEQEETRTTKWNLSHNSPCEAIIERVTVRGPLLEKIPIRNLGQRIEPRRFGPAPIEIFPGIHSLSLPIENLP